MLEARIRILLYMSELDLLPYNFGASSEYWIASLTFNQWWRSGSGGFWPAGPGTFSSNPDSDPTFNMAYIIPNIFLLYSKVRSGVLLSWDGSRFGDHFRILTLIQKFMVGIGRWEGESGPDKDWDPVNPRSSTNITSGPASQIEL